MNNMSKRIMSLILALLMVLEVFSPVAVSASTLFEEAKDKPNPELFTESATKNTRTKNSAAEGLFNSPGVKETPKKETKNIQETPAKKEDTTILEVPAKQSSPQKEPDNTIIEAGRQREENAQIKYDKALEKAKIAEENARSNENVNINTKEAVKEGYKSWKVKNRGKAVYKDGKLECTGLLIEVEDYDGRKKTLNYDDILKDKKIIVDKEIKDGIFGSSELTLSSQGLKDIKIKIKVENLKNEKSELSLNKENSNKLEDKENTEEKEEDGLLDKIKNFFADDEQTKGLENDAAAEDATLEISDLDGNNKEERELTQEELEAGLTKVQLPTENAEEMEEGPRFFSFFRAPVRGNESGDLQLEGKKFPIITRFDTSTAVGPIKKGQFFNIHLDEKLTVNDPTTLKSIFDKYGNEIARPTYDKTNNTIIYTILNDINEDLQIPLNIPVDYNAENITLDNEGNFLVTNKVSGLGVANRKDLIPTKVNKYGNISNQIIEPNRKDVTQIIEADDSKYRVYTDAVANPVIENNELVGYNWTIKVTSDTDLSELGYKANFTTVKGSGLGEISSRDNSVTLNKQLDGAFGINDSKHHEPTAGTKEITYNLYTPVNGRRSAYMLDISVILTKKGKVGAKRLIVDEAYSLEKIAEKTPTRVGMNNRTSILGEFDSENTAKWTITDGVSTGDDKGEDGKATDTKLPWKTRKLEGGQTLKQDGGKVAVYKIDPTTGGMVQVGNTQTVNAIQNKGENPNTNQPVGTIAVYEYSTDTKDSETKNAQSLGGVEISRFEDLHIDQNWNLDKDLKMPAQTLNAVDPEDNTILGTTGENGVKEETPGTEARRDITIKDVKVWNFKDGKLTKVQPKVVQTFPTNNQTSDGKTISYYENHNYYDSSKGQYYIHNRGTVEEVKGRANFKIIKTDKKDPKKKLEGAKFKLLGGPEVVTDSNGEAVFNNVAPGTYTIFETKAPNGYKLNQENSTIKIDENGAISLESGPASISVGTNPTKTVSHPTWPDYMNAMQYATKDANGNVVTYIFLKANEAQRGGSTDKNTRINLRMNDGSISDVKVYDVNNSTRASLKIAMTKQTAESMIDSLGASVLNNPHKHPINGHDNVYDQFLQKSGYQISLPKERFASDWGFLVKVTGKGTSLSYDWLTDTNNVATEARIQDQNIVPTNTTDKNKETTITITNETFETRPVAVKKLEKVVNKETKKEELKPIVGATFEIRDPNGNVISTAISQAADKNGNNEGLASFGNLPEGKYTIEEVEAPVGYIKSNVVFDVTVDSSNKVTYKPRFKNGSGSPVNGEDYEIEDIEQAQDKANAKVVSLTQDLIVNDKNGGSIGKRPGVWEAYFLESLKYTATINLSNSTPGTRFSIQFDRNLDFTQYFGEFPKLKINGVEVADPYFDYTTNKLTYVFNDKSNGGIAKADIELVGIIPSKFFAQNDGNYDFTVTVAPNQNDITSNQTITKTITADYSVYDTDPKFSKPSQSYYFRDVYKDEKGDWYVTALAYYNPDFVNSGSNDVLNFNWKATNYQEGNYVKWKGNGQEPPYSLRDVKIYRTSPNMGKIEVAPYEYKRVNYNMPLSFGVRPEQDPSTYTLIYSRSIDPNTNITDDRNGDIVLNYDKNKINPYGTLQDKGPLSIKMPKVNDRNRDGYIIEQTFKIDDMHKFSNTWRAFNMANGDFNSAFVSRANVNKATGDQTGGEIPKFYSREVGLINKKYTPGKFKILKTKETDNSALPGASFSLTDEEKRTIYRSSGADGSVNFEDLKPGSYTLKEEKAPTGWVKTDRRWNVNVSIGGIVTITEVGLGATGDSIVGDTVKIAELPVTNKPVNPKFVVYKKDNENKPLEGAEFKITTKDGKQVATGTSVTGGVVNFTSALSTGTYILEETKAPDGYQKLDKKWVVEVDANNKVKIYNYSDSSDTTVQEFKGSLLVQDNVKWVNVSRRPTGRFIPGDNRQTGYLDNATSPYRLGTRIVGINKKDKYVIQRYVINPEGKDIDIYNALIHREKLNYDNMSWYKGDEVVNIYTLDKPVTTNVEDIRLYGYKVTDITNKVERKPLAYSYSDRLQLIFKEENLKDTNGESLIKGKPIIVDVKIPYTSESGGIGTGMDLNTSEGPAWKSDFYEQVSDIVVGDLVKQEGSTDNIKGSYISDDYLDVTNEKKKYEFSFDKVNEEINSQGKYDAVTGATFKLVGPGTSTDTKWTHSDENGKVEFKDLAPGTYKLVEHGAAQGYEQAKTDWTVTVKEDGKIYLKENNETRSEKNTEVKVGNWSRSSLYSAPLLLPLNLMNRSAALNEAMGEPDPFEINNGLIGGEPVGAGQGWEKVDLNKSGGQYYTRGNDGTWVTTRISEVNKSLGKFRQIFEVKEGTSSPVFYFRTEPYEGTITGGTRNAKNTFDFKVNSVKVGGINKTWKNAKFFGYNANGKSLTGYQIQLDGYQDGKVLIEVEYAYPQTGEAGMGMEFRPYSSSPIKYASQRFTDVKYVNIDVKKDFNITFGNMVNGSVSADKTNPIPQGESVTLTVNPKKGYVLDSLTVDGQAVSVNAQKQYLYTMPNHDVVVNATFKEKPQTTYTVWVNNTKISASPSQNVAAGTPVTITVSPGPNEELDTLTYSDGNNTVNIDKTTKTFNMPAASVTVNATFKTKQPTEHTITTSVNDPNLGSLTVDKNKAKAGDKVTVTVTPKDNTVEITSVNVGGTNIGPQLKNGVYTFDMPDNDVNIEATFNKKTSYSVSGLGVEGKGKVVITEISDKQNNKAFPGEVVKFKVEANPGLEVVKDKVYVQTYGGKRITPVFDGEVASFTMPADGVTIYAQVYQNETVPEGSKTVNIDKPIGGSVSVDPRIAKIGSKVRLNLQPDDGYAIKSYRVTKAIEGGGNVEVKSDADGWYFIMPDTDVTVYSRFGQQSSPGDYAVNISGVIQNGTVSANLATANTGDIISLKASPKQGFKLDKFTVTNDSTGKEIPLVGNSFTMPASSVSISASFIEYDPELGILIKDGNKVKPVQITNRKDGITPRITKTDTDGTTKLEGAVFTVKKMTDEKYETEDKNFKAITGTSDADGIVTFKDKDGNVVKLQKGYYLLTEDKSPDGYKRNTAPWKMEVKDDGGRMYAVYKGPTDTPSSLIDNKEKVKDHSGKGITVKSRLTYINPESKTYVQRIYIDTRNYTGSDFVNVQITPKYKREEIDRAGLPPVTIKEGVKTAYRSTYEIVNPGENAEIKSEDYDKILRTYDLSQADMKMVNTARWRPFDWGFDEDQLNLGKGVYIVEVEGYYDDAIIDGRATNEVYVDKNFNFTDAQGNPSDKPVKKAPYKKAATEINPADYGKIDLHVDFYDGKREFKQRVYDAKGRKFDWKTFDRASYQAGMQEVAKMIETLYGENTAKTWANSKPDGQKYANYLSKEADFNYNEFTRHYESGKIDPALGNPKHHADTSVDLNPIYSSTRESEVPKEGLIVENEKEKYNITFSKHGRDKTGKGWENNSENVTKNRLEGAVFKLQKDVGGVYEDVPGSTIASAFNGYFGFRNLTPGRYAIYEVQPPKGYRAIKDPLLYFTVETIKTNSGKIVDPESGKVIDIKTIKVKFPDDDKDYNIADLYMTDSKDATKKILIKDADSKDISMDTIIYKTSAATDTAGKALKELSIPSTETGADKQYYSLSQTRIIPGSSGYVSLEYEGANGVYQYVPEKTTSEKDGKLVDYVTSATAKNMGKIINEKPGKGKITIKKQDGEGHALEGASFKLTRTSSNKDPNASTDDNINFNATSDAEGNVEFKDLPIGNYELVETKSKGGYQNKGQRWRFIVGGKDLDPYSEPIARTGSNLTDKISISKSEMEIIRPDNDPNTKKENTIWPNSAQMFRFNNEFKLADGITIKPGDYFEVKLSDNNNLYDIYNKDTVIGLDIFADGIGTTAKAEYDDVKGIITYTFTEAAKTYELKNFNTSIIAHIDRYKVTNSENNVPVGFKMNSKNAADTFKEVNVVVDLGTHTTPPNNYRSYPNMSSKITYFDYRNGEFEHIFYVNRDQRWIGDGSRFTYKPEKEVENLRMEVYRVNDKYLADNNQYKEANKNYILPPSYAVNTNQLVNDGYIYWFNQYPNYGVRSKTNPAVYSFPKGYLEADDTYIIRVTGNIKDQKDKSDYEAQGKLDRYNSNNYPYMGVERHDYVYGLLNANTAEGKLEVIAKNPKNEISFKKIDPEGRVLKDAKFALVKLDTGSNKWIDVPNSEKTTNDKGLVQYEKLAEGKYALIEKEAPIGFNKIEGHIQEFTVGSDGVISREVTRTKENNNPVSSNPVDKPKIDSSANNKPASSLSSKVLGTVSGVFNKVSEAVTGENSETEKVNEPIGIDPINVVNYKKIEFIKLDGDDPSKALQGAEFEVYYKENDTEDYRPYQVDKTNEKGEKVKETLKVTSGKDGKFKLPISKDGFYALKETKAPTDYAKMPGYIREFKLQNGSVLVLEKDPLKSSITRGKKGQIVSQVIEVAKDKKTFKQRIVINPKHQEFTGINDFSYLRILENGWSITPKVNNNIGGGEIKVALLKKDPGEKDKKSIAELTEKDFTTYNPISYKTAGSDTGSRYSLKELLGKKGATTDISTTDTIVVEYTGKLADITKPVDQKAEFIIDNKILDTAEYNLDVDQLSKTDPIYVDVDKSNITPIEVENRKAEYPHTGGMGTLIFTVSGLILMTAAAYVYSRKRRESYDE